MAITRVPRITPADVRPHWDALCTGIGERRAGGEGERRAAGYVLDQLRAAGLRAPRLEPFPCTTLVSADARVEVHDGRRWSPAPCEVLVGSPSTDPADRLTEMDLV